MPNEHSGETRSGVIYIQNEILPLRTDLMNVLLRRQDLTPELYNDLARLNKLNYTRTVENQAQHSRQFPHQLKRFVT